MTELLAEGDTEWVYREYDLSDCSTCLIKVWFPRISSMSEGSRPPMQEAGLKFVRLSNGTLARTMTFIAHDCDESGRVNPATGQVVLTRGELWEQQVQIAFTKTCPKCGAVPKDSCTDMRAGKFNGNPVRWPHTERIDAPAS